MKVQPRRGKVSLREIGFCSILLGFTALLLALPVFFFPLSAEAGPCTKGVNCYCDKVAPGGPLADPQILVCEDFEAPTLHDNVGAGQGAPYFGPWSDASPTSNNRGQNSYWARKYGNGIGACLWATNQPANPQVGASCTGFENCVGTKVWHPTNLWGANNLMPCLTVLKNGEFNAEIAAITPPTNASGGGSGVFDGQQSLGHRNNAGLGGDAGITGVASFGGVRRTFGVTMAMAFPNNIGSTGIGDDAWKFNEWHPTIGGAGGDGIFGFGYSGGGFNTFFPFYGFMFVDAPNVGPAFTAACNAALAAAIKTTGSFSCNDVSLIWFPGGNYNRPTDWPFGTWGCMRGFYQNMGLTNTSIQIYFTGPSGVEKKVVDISGMNTSMLQASGGYDSLIWNNYYNGNYNNGINRGTTSTAFRYEDNVHIRAGAPVSCAQIGFSPSGPSGGQTTPSAPSGTLAQ